MRRPSDTTVGIDLRYYDIVTIKHKDTKVFLHSHPERYPLKYDDGRISSQGMSSACTSIVFLTSFRRPTSDRLWSQ